MTLPEGWILRVSRSKGKVFYYNTLTQQTQWTRPTHAAAAAAEAASDDVERLAKKRKRDDDADAVGARVDAAPTTEATASQQPQFDDMPVAASERRAAIARCIRVGASSGGKAFTPWDHQVDAVDKVLESLELPPEGAGTRGNRFLLQHSTGSGKTVTIAALTHQLLYFQDTGGRRFHTVVLLIDRIKLDEQVGDSVERFLRRNGFDAVYRATSIDHLASLLTPQESRTETIQRQRVVITTIQKIGLLAKNSVLLTRLLQGTAALSDGEDHVFSRIAIITDEAHRSHTAATRQTIEAVMSAGDENRESLVTFVGLTATPNVEALRLFGSASSHSDDMLEPFHSYSMSRAVADNRIVDVLQNYTCVGCELEVSIPSDVQEQLVETNAMRAVMDAASDHIDVLKAKSALMMKDFEQAKAAWKRAKCMIVTRSRRDVVRYYELISAFLQNKRSSWRVFAVFSGAITVESCSSDPLRTVTEQSLNTKHLTLASSDIVIVCDKLDTGYSDPLLARMYIDRYLRSSVHTVQLLSRLNRRHPDKHDVRIVDFANHAAQIRRHFATFWHEAKTRHDGDGLMAQLADWRTAVTVICSIIATAHAEPIQPDRFTEHLEMFERTLDRDAFQQLLDSVRTGTAAWCRMESHVHKCAEAMSSVRPCHFSAVKAVVEEAIAPAKEALVAANDVVAKMQTRVHKYETRFTGRIDPEEIHVISSENQNQSKPSEIKISHTNGLQYFEKLLQAMASVKTTSHPAAEIVSGARLTTSRLSSEDSKLDRLSASFAMYVGRALTSS